VEIGVTPHGLEPSPPIVLFPAQLWNVQGFGSLYAPLPDGQEFLMNIAQPVTSPITLILNWKGKP
jgi:hypothetical protein